MKRFNLLSLVLLAVLGLAQLQAADIYVRAGSSGRGSKEDPYGFLWMAVDKAQRGDVIHVAAGTYNGKLGSGHFKITVPNLTMVGGYNADFSARDPFKNLTILERAKDYRGDWVGLPEGIIAGDERADHSGLTVDGFVLNGQSRNHYQEEGRRLALKAPTYLGSLFQANSKNIKILNCVILNAAGNGIYCTWQGTENEIRNCFVLNSLYSAIETRSAQPGSKILIKGNTIAFVWFQPSKGGGIGVFVGSQGSTVIQDNVFAFFQTEGGEAGFAVTNTFGNIDTVMTGNVFFSCAGGYYKYMDAKKANLVLYKPADLDILNDEVMFEDFSLAQSGGNRAIDPGLRPDKDFALLYANFVESVPGRLDMDAMNQWRQAMGLPLQGGAASARPILAPAYPLTAVVPNLVSSIAGVGAQPSAQLASYSSAAAAQPSVSIMEILFATLKKGTAQYQDGTTVRFRAAMGDPKLIFEIDAAPRTDYIAVMLMAPGSTSTSTRDYAIGYLLKGSKPHQDWDKLAARRANYAAQGVQITGVIYNFKNQTYPYPYGIVISEVSR